MSAVTRTSLAIVRREHNAPSAFGADRCIGPAPNSRACPQSLDVRVSQNQIVRRYQRQTLEPCGGDQHAIDWVFVKMGRQIVGFRRDFVRQWNHCCMKVPERERPPFGERLLQVQQAKIKQSRDFKS